MASLKKINLGVFPAGEIPAPVEHTFQDESGVPIDMQGWVLLGLFIERDGEDLGVKEIEWADQSVGKVRYRWKAEDFFEPGSYEALFWVQNDPDTPSERLGSDLIVYSVVDGPGVTPT